MKIVIDISDQKYKWIVDNPQIYTDDLCEAIRNGTPLPQHHGRLIDADKVLDDIEKQYPASASETEKSKRYARLVYYWAVKNAPTIIEGSDSE